MLYSRNALCRWDIIVLTVVFVLALGACVHLASRLLCANHVGVQEAARLGGFEAVRDFLVAEQVGVVRLGSRLVFCIANPTPEGVVGSLTRCLPVLHDVVAGVVAGRVRGVSEGLKQ